MKKKLKDMATLVNGYAFKSEKYVDNGIRVIRIANVQDGYLSDESPCYYPNEYKDVIKNANLCENDLLMSLTGNVGRVAFVTKDFLPAGLNQRVECIRPNESGDKEYLYYYFRSQIFKGKVNSATTGCAQQNLSIKWLENHEIPYYDNDRCKKIVDDLKHFDCVISNKKEQLKLLDELIKSRFIEMFGDVNIANTSFEIKKLDEVAFVGSSHRVFTTEFVESGVPFYRGTEIGELANGIKPTDVFYITKEHYEKLSNDYTKPKYGDLLIPSICNKGQVWMVDTDEPFYYKDGRVLRVSPDLKKFNCLFMLYYMRFKTEYEYQKLDTGPTFSEFKIFIIKNFDVIIPPIELQNTFGDFVKQVDKSKFIVQKQIEDLQELLDSKMDEYFG